MAQDERGTAAAVAVSLGVLLVTAPTPPAALGALAGATAGTDPTGPLVAAVALLAWSLAAWLALTVAVVLLSRVPGGLGRTGRALGSRLAPATVRRAVEAVLGLTVAVGAFAPTAALAAPVPRSAATAAVGATGQDRAWDLDWPSVTSVSPARPAGTPTAAPVQVRPAPVTPPPAAAVTSSPVVQPPSAAPAPVAPARRTVVVRPGDSLWSLAESSLRAAGTVRPTDRQVAQAWPRWWAANRETVGDDPDLLLPGTVLRRPS